MRMSKKWQRLLLSSLAVGAVTFTPVIYNFNGSQLPMVVSVAQAEIQTYTGTGEYLMSDGETMDIAKQGAKMHAIRNAQEQAGIFLSSRSEVKNGKLTKDEIETFTVGVIKVREVKYKPVPLDDEGGYIKFIATVTVTIDTDDLNQKVNEWLNKKAEDRSKSVNDITSMQKQIDEQAKRIKELEQIIVNSHTNLDKNKINAELKTIDNNTLAIQKNEEGIVLSDKKDYNGAIKLFTEAIQLAPNYAAAYNNRGAAYQNIKNYKKSIVDFDKSIQINPYYAAAYKNRGNAYLSLKNYKQAIADFDKAIQLNPNNVVAYRNRGLSYQALGENKKAQADFAKAKSLSL